MRAWTIWPVMALALALATPAHAVDGDREDLTPGSIAAIVYGDDQLGDLPASGTLVYRYRMEGEILPEPFEDIFELSFGDAPMDAAATAGESESRAFTIKMFKNTRTLTLPPMPADTVNPLFLVFFQRDVNQLKANTGGNVHYFRNLIRTAMNQPGEAEPVTVDLDGKQVEATKVTFSPFGGEGARIEGFNEKSYSIILSDAVPGTVYELQTTVPAEDGDGITLRETYRFEELTP